MGLKRVEAWLKILKKQKRDQKCMIRFKMMIKITTEMTLDVEKKPQIFIMIKLMCENSTNSKLE